MNIRKIGVWVKETNGVKQMPYWITKGWRKVYGYKTRGYRNRVKLVGRSKTYIDNPHITKHIKRNRIHKLVYQSYALSK